MDDRGRWSGLLREGRRVFSKGGIVDLVNKDTEEGGGLVTRTRPKLRIDLDDERRGDSGKQTGLRS